MTARKQEAPSGEKTAAKEATARRGTAPDDKPEAHAQRYRFVVGVTLAALEAQVNQLTADPHGPALKQVLFATGTGFIAVLEQG